MNTLLSKVYKIIALAEKMSKNEKDRLLVHINKITVPAKEVSYNSVSEWILFENFLKLFPGMEKKKQEMKLLENIWGILKEDPIEQYNLSLEDLLLYNSRYVPSHNPSGGKGWANELIQRGKSMWLSGGTDELSKKLEENPVTSTLNESLLSESDSVSITTSNIQHFSEENAQNTSDNNIKLFYKSLEKPKTGNRHRLFQSTASQSIDELDDEPKLFFINITLLKYLFILSIGKEDVDIKFEMMLSIFHTNGLDKQTMYQLLSICLSNNELSSIQEKLPEFIDILFELIDTTKSGKITLDSFKMFYSQMVTKKQQHNTEKSRESVAIQAPIFQKKRHRKVEAALHFCLQEGLLIFCFVLFVLGNIIFFVKEFTKYAVKDNITGIIGWTVPLSRGGAGAIKFNLIWILLPVCRSFMTYCRSTVLDEIVPFDEGLRFHRACAVLIIFWSVVHTVGHICNAYFISQQSFDNLRIAVGNYFDVDYGSHQMWRFVFTTLPGITGILIWICLLCIALFAWKKVRTKNYELFYTMHHFFVGFFGLTFIHGMSALLNSPEAYLYMLIPVGIYATERVMRMNKTKYALEIHRIQIYPLQTIILEVKRPANFQYLPGQYANICIPNVSRMQWHPYSLTSSPEQNVLSFAIRRVGNWTNQLIKVVQTTPKENIRVYIDGPFGASAQYSDNYKVVMLIGAGIGITPFAGVVRHIKFQLENRKTIRFAFEKVYLYWSCREQMAFSWFSDMLTELEKVDVDHLVELNSYITSAKKRGDIASFFLWLALEYYHGRGKDALTSLNSKTNFGRPNYSAIFDSMLLKHPNCKIGVFFCGAKALGKDLQKMCFNKSTTSTQFEFFRERF